MANERALGLSFIYAAQTRAQLTSLFGEHESRALVGLTNVLVVFGGSKDVASTRKCPTSLALSGSDASPTTPAATVPRSYSGDDIAIMRPEEVRRLPERKALVIAENGKPIVAKLDRCVAGKKGAALLAQQRDLRRRLTQARPPSRRWKHAPALPSPKHAASGSSTTPAPEQPHIPRRHRRHPRPAVERPLVSIHQERSVHAPIVLPFPQPGVLVRLAYREINVAANGTPEEQKGLGPHALLPRPWDPDSCTEAAALRARAMALARPGRDLVEPRVHLGQRSPRAAVLAGASAPGARDRGRRRPATTLRSGEDQRRARGVAPVLPPCLRRPDEKSSERAVRRRALTVAGPAESQ